MPKKKSFFEKEVQELDINDLVLLKLLVQLLERKKDDILLESITM